MKRNTAGYLQMNLKHYGYRRLSTPTVAMVTLSISKSLPSSLTLNSLTSNLIHFSPDHNAHLWPWPTFSSNSVHNSSFPAYFSYLAAS
ncbi:hypothetical protein CEXT_613281 [Caerostris extrusa]|uniref:Uncharacterized protein n=1 Tax=Caerostris extrusa TaxID=172846 RepID=A0AAV4N742_CAEEX|nr:hypothetical protein CEXT_613281 [Caerostris extrusa]